MPAARQTDELRLTAWQTLDNSQRAAVALLQISPQQIEYAGTVARAIEGCEADDGSGVLGIALLHGATVVGFLACKRDKAAPAWAPAGAAVISGLRIDARWQGKGMATAALRLLPDWLAQHWPENPQIVLSVDEDNLAGIRAYEKAGWVDRGVREEGRIGWVRYMHFNLQASGA